MEKKGDTLRAFVAALTEEERRRYDALRGLPTIEYPRAVRLPNAEPGWFDNAYAITLDGSLAVMRTSVDIHGAWKSHCRKSGSRRTFRMPDCRARVSVFEGRAESEAVEFLLPFVFPRFDRLADGAWLVADNLSNCPEDPNAVIVEPDGSFRRRVDLGDDIQHLQADPDGGFWLGYGDAGIFSGAHGVEAGGVVRFDAAGEAVWSLNQSAKTRRHAWCDHAYALNISRDGRWCYTYSGFLLTQMDAADGPRSLRPMLDFAQVFAVSDGRVLMGGGASYPRDGGARHGYELLVLLDPPGPRKPRRLIARGGGALHQAQKPPTRLWTARGDTIHCVRGRTWHRLSVDEADGLMLDAS